MIRRTSINVDAGLLLIRLGLATVFLYHGILKAQDMPGTISFFTSLGLPSIFAYLVAAGEIVGGLSMFLGIFTNIFGAVLTLIMIGALGLVKLPLAGWNLGRWELDLLVLLCALSISLSGPGKYSLSSK